MLVGSESTRLSYIRRGGVALQEGLDGLVLLVELGKVGDEVLDDVGVGQGVDAGLGLGVGGDAAWVAC